jgi:hypothetical protein
VISGALCAPQTQRRNTVITFNYDTVLEAGFDLIGQRYDCQLDPSRSTQESAATPLLKIHGSINWSRPLGAPEDAPLVERADYAAVRRCGDEVAILPPTWRKTFGGSLGRMWDAAVGAVSSATRLIVVGFSLPATDTHFKYLLAAGLRDNISLRKVIFVNPAAEEALFQARIRSVFRPELFHRHVIEPCPLTAAEFFIDRGCLAQINRPLLSGIDHLGLRAETRAATEVPHAP